MLSTWILATVLACGQAEPAQGGKKDASAVKDDLKSRVTRLARQLDDNQLAKREAAEKELVELGPSALPHLPQVTRQTPAEVKDRLNRVRRALESAAAESVTRPAKITLEGEMKLAAALTALAEQSGNQLVDFRDRFGQQTRSKDVKLDLKERSFWESLDTLLDQCELTTYHYTGQRGTLGVVARSEGDLPRLGRATYSSLFRFEATRVEAVRDLRNPMNDSLRLTIDMSWEPRLQPIVIAQALDTLSAVDEQGRALAIDNREGELEVEGDGETSSSELVIPLRLPGRTVEKIGSVKGQLRVLAPGRTESFEFGDLDKIRNAEHRRAAVTVFVDQVRKNQEVQEVRMRVKFDSAANALESHRNWVQNNVAVLLDPNGKQVENAGMESTLQEDDQVGIAYQFVVEGSLKGYKFVYTTPVSILQFPVDFEVKDISLP